MSDARLNKLVQLRIQQAQQALVISQGETISKHSGLISFFDRVYIKPGIFPKDLSKVLHLAFDRRQANDYGEFSSLDQAEVDAALKDAEVFVNTVAQYLQK